MRLRHALSALVVCTAASLAGAANPAYDSWAKHNPGTMVKMSGATEAMGNKTEMEQTFTLKEKTAEKVVVEMKMAMTMMGNKTEMPGQMMEIKADAPAQPTPPAGQPAAPAADAKTSEETVTVAGKEYKATCTETKSDANGMKTTAKVWTSPEIPGQVLKTEAMTEGQMTSKTTLMVTAVELK